MPSLNQLPSDINRNKFAKALKRLGFNIDKTGGKGSHFKAEWPRNGKCIAIKDKMRKDTLYYLLKEIKSISGITWDQIRSKM